jgi:hypothetical protein
MRHISSSDPAIPRYVSFFRFSLPHIFPPEEMESRDLIDRCTNSPIGGILTSCSSSSCFAAAAATYHSPVMSLPGPRGTTTDSAWRLPSRRLRCRRGRSSSVPHCLGHYPTYSYVGHTLKSATTRRDLNGRRLPPWYPTPGAAT